MIKKPPVSIIVLLSFLISTFAAAGSHVEKNLLKNPGFQLALNSRPAGWVSVLGESKALSLDKNESLSFLKISHKNKQSTTYLYQSVVVEPNTNYILTYQIRMENIVAQTSGQGAKILISDENGNTLVSSESLYGTIPWREQIIAINSGNRNKLRVYIYLEEASGDIWFDNLSFGIPNDGNIIKNAQFELDLNGRPTGWISVAGESNAISFEKSDKNGNSLKINHKNKQSYTYIRQTVDVKPNSIYILTCRIKTENIVAESGGSRGARIFANDEKGSGMVASKPIYGTTPWQEYALEINTGTNRKLAVFMYLHKSSGTVWFDDLKLILKSTMDQTPPIEENVLGNANFKLDSNGRPTGWISVAGESNAISFEKSDKNGNSLKINHKNKQSYTYIRQTVDVKPNSIYILTCRIKTENIVAESGGSRGARIFANDEKGSGMVASKPIYGTTPWQEYALEINTGTNRKLAVFMYLHKSSGTVWFDDLKLILKDSTASLVEIKQPQKVTGIPLRLSSQITSKFYFSPENGLKNEYLLKVYSNFNIGDTARVRFSFYPIYESVGGGFEIPQKKRMLPRISYLTIRFTGPILPKTRPVTITAGEGILAYSPYIATINTSYSKRGQGIIVEGIKVGKIDLGGFFFWEPQKPYRDVGEGIRIRIANGPWKANAIMVSHLNGNPTMENGKIISLGHYNLIERDIELQFEYQFKNNVKLNVLRVEQQGKRSLTRVLAKETFLVIPYGKLKCEIAYRDFQPGFAPRYHRTTPLYNSYTYLGWNPVERYRNQRGYAATISGPFLGREMTLELDQYTLVSNNTYRRGVTLNLVGTNELKMVCKLDDKEKTLRYLSVQTKRKLTKKNWGSLNSIINFIYDSTGGNNDLLYKGLIKEFGVESKFNNGFLSGLSLYTGVQKAEGYYSFVRGQWVLLRNIKIDFSYRNLNIKERSDYWVDDYERLHFRDNYISLSSGIAF